MPKPFLNKLYTKPCITHMANDFLPQNASSWLMLTNDFINETTKHRVCSPSGRSGTQRYTGTPKLQVPVHHLLSFLFHDTLNGPVEVFTYIIYWYNNRNLWHYNFRYSTRSLQYPLDL